MGLSPEKKEKRTSKGNFFFFLSILRNFLFGKFLRGWDRDVIWGFGEVDFQKWIFFFLLCKIFLLLQMSFFLSFFSFAWFVPGSLHEFFLMRMSTWCCVGPLNPIVKFWMTIPAFKLVLFVLRRAL